MAIPDEDVAQVRAATDIVALIGEHAALKHQGRRWVGLCPFHAEKSPSFSVNAEEGFYYCFGCQKSGDAITFVRETEHLDFVDAVRYLADKAGVVIHEDVEAGHDRQKRAQLTDAVERAVVWYHQRLLSSKDAGPARDYLRSRGYDGDVVRQFRLGWAPDGWDLLAKELGLSAKVLTDSGLGFVNRAGRQQDAFRSRIIFPICDPSGHPVALGGRILPPTGGAGTQSADRRPEPKYKNSQESPIYSKRRTLYALNWAKHDIVASSEVVVCEGYTDVIGFFQAGVPRAVATCGTALAEEHFRLLRNFGKRIVLAYDADSAGQNAISRVYEWERTHEVDVAVAALPEGSDPGELARSDPEALAQAVRDARPFLQFRVDRVFQAGNLTTAEGRARTADAALAAVAEHPDELVRDQYVMQVADHCRLDPALVRERLEHARRNPKPPDTPRRGRSGKSGAMASGGGAIKNSGADDEQPPMSAYENVEEWEEQAPHDTEWDGAPSSRARRAGRPDPAGRPGLEALRLAVHHPELVVDRLEEILFTDPVQRQAFALLLSCDGTAQAIAEAPPEVADLLRRIVVEEPDMGDADLGDPVDSVITVLVREAARRGLTQLQADARSSPGESFAALNAEAGRVRLWLEELDDPEAGRAAGGRLVAWLMERGLETT